MVNTCSVFTHVCCLYKYCNKMCTGHKTCSQLIRINNLKGFYLDFLLDDDSVLFLPLDVCVGVDFVSRTNKNDVVFILRIQIRIFYYKRSYAERLSLQCLENYIIKNTNHLLTRERELINIYKQILNCYIS